MNVFPFSKYYSLIVFFLSVLIAQNQSTLFDSSASQRVNESESFYTATLVYDFEGTINSRRFENLRSKSRLDAIDQIAAYIYINTIYDINTSNLAHPNIFIDVVATLKPYNVKAKISKLKSLHFGRLTPNTIKAVFSMPKDQFKIVELTKSSITGMSVKEILNKASNKQNRNEEIVLWLLDLEESFLKRQKLISNLTSTIKLADISELEDAAFTKLNLNETIVKSVVGEISFEQKNKYVSDGIVLINNYSRKDFFTYSNIIVAELLKYGVQKDKLLNIYIQNIKSTDDQQWTELIQFVQKQVIDTNHGFIEDSLIIVNTIYTSLGLLNLENEQFDDAYKNHYNQGMTYFTESKIDSSLIYFLNSLENESINANVLNFIGACYRIKGEPEYALPFLIQCLLLDSNHEYAWGNLAICLHQLGYNYTNAFHYFGQMAYGSKWSINHINQIIKEKL